MKYLVNYFIDGSSSVYVFDSHDDAVDYINETNEVFGDNISEIRNKTSYSDERYAITFSSGMSGYITVEERPDDKVRFDLLFIKNGSYVETRRFTKRYLAVNFANRILDEHNAEAGDCEDEFGEWVLDDKDRELSIILRLTVVVLGEKSSNDFDVLGVKPNASEEEIKRAYRKLSKENHPDMGGDAKEFERISKAYERIKSGAARKTKQNIEEEYNCADMRSFFKKVNHEIENKKNVVREEIRNIASKLVIRGLIEVAIGGIFSLSTINSKSSSNSGWGTIFAILLFYGVWNIAKGMFYIIKPDAAMKKK